MISRHFPPEISGGARRAYLFAEHLHKRNIELTVISPFQSAEHQYLLHVPHPVFNDHNDVKKLKTSALKTPQASLKSTAKIRNFARRWLLWPDPEIRWHHRVMRELSKRTLSFDIVMTTSPPESAHMIGARLKKELNAIWIAEFRDTWFTAPHRQILVHSYFRRTIERVLAKRALSSVDAVTAVSNSVLQDIRSVIPKGTPELCLNHFSKRVDDQFAFDSQRINLVHAGGFTLSDHRRHPDVFLSILEKITAPNVTVHMLGPLTLQEKEKFERNTTVEFKLYGEVPLMQSRAMQNSADALLLITPEKSHALPGKYAEYRVSQKAIFYVGGGSWLDLAENESLIPLSDGIQLINKDKLGDVPILETQLYAEEAAETLIDFFQELLQKGAKERNYDV